MVHSVCYICFYPISGTPKTYATCHVNHPYHAACVEQYHNGQYDHNSPCVRCSINTNDNCVINVKLSQYEEYIAAELSTLHRRQFMLYQLGQHITKLDVWVDQLQKYIQSLDTYVIECESMVQYLSNTLRHKKEQTFSDNMYEFMNGKDEYFIRMQEETLQCLPPPRGYTIEYHTIVDLLHTIKTYRNKTRSSQTEVLLEWERIMKPHFTPVIHCRFCSQENTSEFPDCDECVFRFTKRQGISDKRTEQERKVSWLVTILSSKVSTMVTYRLVKDLPECFLDKLLDFIYHGRYTTI